LFAQAAKSSTMVLDAKLLFRFLPVNSLTALLKNEISTTSSKRFEFVYSLHAISWEIIVQQHAVISDSMFAIIDRNLIGN
jgi:hypothetical protein